MSAGVSFACAPSARVAVAAVHLEPTERIPADVTSRGTLSVQSRLKPFGFLSLDWTDKIIDYRSAAFCVAHTKKQAHSAVSSLQTATCSSCSSCSHSGTLALCGHSAF
uniref:Secreted protein n=1 Tax=Knipowitschia caucasica TaxID=637954 RepID=A0AAV2LQ86_KNICA